MKAVALKVMDDLTVRVIPDKTREFLMCTKDVAAGYGVSPVTIRHHRNNHKVEFSEGVHFIRGGHEMAAIQNMRSSKQLIFWTKRGIIRLGFYVQSERGKKFRDWVEQLVLDTLNRKPAVTQKALDEGRLRYNRLNPDRLIKIMDKVMLVKEDYLRIEIMDLLMGRR